MIIDLECIYVCNFYNGMALHLRSFGRNLIGVLYAQLNDCSSLFVS